MKFRTKSAAVFAALSVAGLACLFYSYFAEPNLLVVSKEKIEIAGWNSAFDNFKIVAITDLHGGSNGASDENIRRLVKKTNEQNADIIVLLGDYVSQYKDGPSGDGRLKMPMSEVAENLKGLRAKYGVFAVLGNHDGYYDDKIVAAELQRVGIRVLQNEIVSVEKDGQALRIFGLKDHLKLRAWDGFDSDVRAAAAKSKSTGNFLVLEHSPDIFPILNYFKSLGPDFKLMLAGHTHGGQVSLPIIGSPIVPSSFGQKYNRGRVNEDGAEMFVTTGVGTSILPFRFLVPPEIAVLTISPK